jgi:anaerobic magnesium-protoporphyrin IX monomethyl ester cyclase
MRVLLVGPDLEENLSLRYLASSLRAAGHEPAIAVFETAADAPAVLAAAKSAEVVGLSMCYQIRAAEFLALARDLKRQNPDQRVVAGGHYASCAATDLLDCHPELDLVAIHECERTLPELVSTPAWTEEALGAIPGLVFRGHDGVCQTPAREALSDLDSLPWPDRSGPARLMAGVPTAYMMGSRGCLSACDYCCISTMHRMVSGKRFRQRSPEDIVQEMAYLYHERGVRQFIFHDDNFLVPQVERNLARIDDLDRGMRRQGLRRVALALKCRPGDVNRQVFLRLREMGLLRVFLGIESGSHAGLASIGRRQTVEQEHQALSLCEDLGISTQYTIIMFHPEATLHSMREDLAFVAAHPGHPLSFCRAEIYTGTPLEQRMVGAGRAYGNYLARAYDYTDPLTTHAWNAAWQLLPKRCFAQDHLLGQIIRLDHQATILRHFYEGRAIDALVDDFARFEREANLDSIALIEEMFALCEAFPDAASAGFRTRFAELREREQSRCDFLLRRICVFREKLQEHSLGTMGLVRATRSAAPERSLLERLPHHAAAVFLAVGLLNCDSKSGLRSAPDGSTADATQAADTKPLADAVAFRDQGGMFEAPPPPMDAPVVPPRDAGSDGGASEAGSLDAESADARTSADATDTRAIADAVVFKDQGGMFEAPPPPMDAPVIKRD